MFRKSAITLICLGMLAYAQTPSPQSAQSPSGLTVAVDGSKTPDQIPDDLAYRHFILAIAEHKNPSTQEYQRREARLAPMGLSPSDHDASIAALAGLRETLDQIQVSRNAISPGDPTASSQFADLKSQEDAAIGIAVGLLRASLTLDGQARLGSYVRGHVKSRIVILGAPPG